MWSTSSLPLLTSPLWPKMISSDRVLSMSQIELFNMSANKLHAKLNCLKKNCLIIKLCVNK